MSTHCITNFLSNEIDGTNLREVARMWRKHDGNPGIHAVELREILCRDNSRFTSMEQMLGRLLEPLINRCADDFQWQFILVDRDARDLHPDYIYELWLGQGSDS